MEKRVLEECFKRIQAAVRLGDVMQGLKNNVLRHIFYQISLTEPYVYVK